MPAPDEQAVGQARAGALIGVRAFDRDGRLLGRVADLIADQQPDGTLLVTHVVVARPPWGRLLGYERVQVRGPWLLQTLAHYVMHRRVRVIAWSDVAWTPPAVPRVTS